MGFCFSANFENSTASGLGSGGSGEMSHEELMCKVGYAVATNLMVGIYQVHSIVDFTFIIYHLFIYSYSELSYI